MTFFMFLLYFAAGAGVGYGVFTYTAVEACPLRLASSAVTIAFLTIIHIVSQRLGLEARCRAP